MQRSSAWSCSGTLCRNPVSLAHINRLNSALVSRPRRFGWSTCAENRYYEKDAFAASMEGLTSKEKDPSRFVDDTSDEEANLPENPIDLDEEIIIPHRPSISDLYKDLRHEWAEPDLTKSGKIVADTSSDEESNLPGNPLDLDEEMMLPQKHMVKEIYEHLPGHRHQPQGEEKSSGAAAVEVDPPPAPGSHEMPEVTSPQHGEREEKMAEAEKDVTKMESEEDHGQHGQPRPRPASELPGLITQDTTMITPGSGPVKFPESGLAENEERIQGMFEAIDKIAEDENRHYLNTNEENDEQQQSPSTTDALSSPSPPSTAAPLQPEDFRSAVKENPSTEASYTGLEGGIDDQMDVDSTHNQDAREEDSYEVNYSGDDDQMILNSNDGSGGGGDEDTPLGRLEFSFKAEDKEEKKNEPTSPSSSTSERLRDVAAKAAAASRELDPLAKLTAAREAHRQHRILTEESLRQNKPNVTMARILEVSAGRSAIIGVFSAIASEILFGQSVLSQLLGRWEGSHQVEAIISQSRTLALGAIALSLGITATETLISAAAPPAGKYFGFSPKQQIWVGRIAMAAFAGIVVYETMHSNRPLFPFWYLLR